MEDKIYVSPIRNFQKFLVKLLAVFLKKINKPQNKPDFLIIWNPLTRGKEITCRKHLSIAVGLVNQ